MREGNGQSLSVYSDVLHPVYGLWNDSLTYFPLRNCPHYSFSSRDQAHQPMSGSQESAPATDGVADKEKVSVMNSSDEEEASKQGAPRFKL